MCCGEAERETEREECDGPVIGKLGWCLGIADSLAGFMRQSLGIGAGPLLNLVPRVFLLP